MAITRPDLAAQWHPTKNGSLTPSDVTAGTHTTAWWLCPVAPDHEWQATGANRLKGTGCPACAGQKASVTNNVAKYPELAAQFHPTKNGDLTPADVVAGTSKKIWWKCPKGPDHEWAAPGQSRLAGHGCPACAGVRVSVTNSLSAYPDLAAQFHPTMNGDLTPAEVVAGSARRFWWACPMGRDHKWQAPGFRRVAGSGCPFCDGKSVSVTNSLGNYEDLARQLHPTKNGQVTPSELVAGTMRNLWWLCPVAPDHEWQATGANRLKGTGCPACAGQKASVTNNVAKYPELAAQFHPTKNGDLTPAQLVAGTNKKIWWTCAAGPDHVWRAPGYSRLAGSGCACCSGYKASVTNDLNNFPELARELHPTRNGTLTPSDVVATSETRRWWQCREVAEHVWLAIPASRVAGSGCPSCAKHGFNPGKAAWLYLLSHSTWGLLQVGITNDLKRRIGVHERSGWVRLDQRGPMDGNLVKAWEKSILKWIKGQGVDADGSTAGGKFDGYTESWPRDALTVTTLRQLMDLVEEDERTEIARAT